MIERYLCLHGHFYQPSRQNPWLEEIEAEASAAPFHDWNQRITSECYAPNAAARIVDGEGRLLEIHNNYASISFNVGPSLLSWLEKADPTTYQQIIAADQLSRTSRGGHGNAIAQAYNHIIMPLANRRDKVTQVVWGIYDFHMRFGHAPEGMWLPETAVDLETLDILTAHGIHFTILSPYQAKRLRAPGETAWREVSGGRIDPSRPYRCLLPSGRDMALYFYDGPIAKSIAFDGVLARGEMLIERLMGGFHDARKHTQLIHVATDGETYGHHHRFGEMALAYALSTITQKKLATLTNYGQYLALFPPDHLVEIFENTSWSCAHGVERWRSDCGCQTGGMPGWHQRWRQPLREALDWLRDHLADLFEDEGSKVFRNPWEARNSYITVIMDRSRSNVERFFDQHAVRRLSDAEMVEAIKLLEMQRHALLMYTSCAWFFAEISGIETVQMLAYAARAMQLAREITGLELESGFLERLAEAPSNLPQQTANGRDVYLKLVRPMVATLRTAIADYGISALIESGVPQQVLGVYEIQEVGAHRHSRANFTLATGRVRVQSQLTGESLQAIYAAFRSDGQEFRCSVKGYVDVDEYIQLQDELFRLFTHHSLTEMVRALDAHFGEDFFTLSHLFPDEQRRLGQLLLTKTLERFGRQCQKLFRANQHLIDFLRTRKVPLPPPLRVATEWTLDAEISHAAQRLLQGQTSPGDLEGSIRAYQDAAKRLECTLNFAPLRQAFEVLVEKHVGLLTDGAGQTQLYRQALEVAQELNLGLNLERAQNIFWGLLTTTPPIHDLPLLLELGTRLGFNQATVSKLLQAHVSSGKHAAAGKLQA
jgi:alpha-amylase/alpha-mannosidase (GH57 family)